MYLFVADIFLVWPKFTMRGRLMFPLNDAWDGYSQCQKEVDKTTGILIRENRIEHGVPQFGQYVEVTKIEDGKCESPWWAFVLRSNAKPCMQWWKDNNYDVLNSEREKSNAEK